MHIHVSTVTFLLVSNQRADLQANEELYHTRERRASNVLPHGSCNCMHGQYGVDAPSTLFSFPPTRCATSVEVSCLIVQRDFPAGDIEWFESVQFLPAVGASRKGCSRAPAPDPDVAFQDSQSVE